MRRTARRAAPAAEADSHFSAASTTASPRRCGLELLAAGRIALRRDRRTCRTRRRARTADRARTRRRTRRCGSRRREDRATVGVPARNDRAVDANTVARRQRAGHDRRCDGSVSGTVLRACVNRTPRDASPSTAGVSPRPTRSARSVSIVISRMFGCDAAARRRAGPAARGPGARPPARARTKARFTGARSYSSGIGMRDPECGMRDAGATCGGRYVRVKQAEGLPGLIRIPHPASRIPTLLRPNRLQRIDARGAAGGDEAGHQRDQQAADADDGEGERIGWRDVEEHAARDARDGQRGRDADRGVQESRGADRRRSPCDRSRRAPRPIAMRTPISGTRSLTV